MNQIVLGKTGEKVSRISLGTWSYGGGNKSGSTSVGWTGQKDDVSREALKKAWELGINHWDTADVYGNGRSEEVIGSVWDSVPRKDIFLATKVGWDKEGLETFYHPSMMRRHIVRSLRNLNVDVIDLYYLHHCNFDTQASFEMAVELMYRFKDEGKIRFIGLSDWDSHKIMKYIDAVKPDAVQPYRNVHDDMYTTSGLKEYVNNQNIGACFFSPIKQGLLTGKYLKPTTFPEGDFRQNVPEFGEQSFIDRMLENKSMLENRFAHHSEPVMHGLVDALFPDSPTGCVLLGQRDASQVQIASLLGEPLPQEDANFVFDLYRKQ